MADGLNVEIGQPFPYGPVPAFTNFAVNAATSQWEVVFAAANDGGGNLVITKVGFRYGVATNTPPTYKISIQGVDASGNPDGVIKGGASPASATFTPPVGTSWDGTWQWITLANSYSAAPGEMLSLVIAYDSGTISATACSSFTTIINNTDNLVPYSIQNASGTRTRMSGGSMAIFGYATASKAYGRPLQSITQLSYNSGTATNEHAIKFFLPAGWSDTFKIAAVRFYGALVAGGNINIQLYDGGNATDLTVLQNVQHDSDAVTSATGRPINKPFDETTLATLVVGNTYRVSFSPTVAVNMTVVALDVASATDWDAWPGGSNFTASNRGGGNWTDVPTRKLLASLVLSSVTEAVSTGGGMIFQRHMLGGLV